MRNNFNSDAPVREALVEASGTLTRAWLDFMAIVSDALFFVGAENSMTLVNNQASAVDVSSLSFDKRYVSAGYVDYLIQRTTSTNEAVESGTFFLAYKPKANAWQISSGPTTSGVTLTINADGQVKYTTTNQTGTLLSSSLSRIVFRARSMRAKSAVYSSVGNAGAR